MKELGKVNKYNGYDGTIVNQSGEEYILLNTQIEEEKEVEQGSLVTFVPETYKNKVKIARFVEPYKKDK